MIMPNAIVTKLPAVPVNQAMFCARLRSGFLSILAFNLLSAIVSVIHMTDMTMSGQCAFGKFANVSCTSTTKLRFEFLTPKSL